MMRASDYFSLLLALGLALHSAESANILVTVVGISGSQNLLMYRLAELMGQRGHNVSVLKAEVLPEAKSIPLKYAKEISYPAVTDKELLDTIKSEVSTLAWSQSMSNPMPHRLFISLFRQLRLACDRQLHNDQFLQSLNDSRFDVVVVHMFDFCSFGLSKALGIDSYVWMSTAMMPDSMAWYSGSPLALSYVPNIMSAADANGRLSFLARIKNSFLSLAFMALFQYGVTGPYTELFRNRFGPDFPHYDDIVSKTQLYFVNSDPFFEYGRPVTANVISVGGLTMEKPEPLTEKWQKIMNNAPKEGVVVFSLGSVANTSSMPQDKRMAFLDAFKRFPHLFIWRFVGAFNETKSVKNVLLADWLPQKDLMAHPNVKAAIIHGGYNSLTETTYMGVPVVVIPLWGDQFGNGVRVTRQNIGVQLDRTALTEDKVYDALKKVLYDKQVQANAKRLGHMIREKPFSSLQQATEWLEFLAKFKRLDQLQPPSQELYLFQYLLLDAIAFIFVVFLIVFFLARFCIKACLRRCKCGGRKKGNEKQKRA